MRGHQRLLDHVSDDDLRCVVAAGRLAAAAPAPQIYLASGDRNGLVLGPDEPRPDLTIVLVNDDGGSIFATLEQGAEQYADRFDRLFGTPHGVDLASLCAATRTPHLQVRSRPELEQALASPNGGIEVVEAGWRSIEPAGGPSALVIEHADASAMVAITPARSRLIPGVFDVRTVSVRV